LFGKYALHTLRIRALTSFHGYVVGVVAQFSEVDHLEIWRLSLLFSIQAWTPIVHTFTAVAHPIISVLTAELIDWLATSLTVLRSKPKYPSAIGSIIIEYGKHRHGRTVCPTGRPTSGLPVLVGRPCLTKSSNAQVQLLLHDHNYRQQSFLSNIIAAKKLVDSNEQAM
jgi:hypothetical protein